MNEIVMKYFGWRGHMLSGSKSGYSNSYPTHLVVFNANLCVGATKVWYGDIDVTLSKDTLTALAAELNDTVYVLYEMDGRFDNEENPKINNYIVRFLPDGEFELNRKIAEYYSSNDLKRYKI